MEVAVSLDEVIEEALDYKCGVEQLESTCSCQRVALISSSTYAASARRRLCLGAPGPRRALWRLWYNPNTLLLGPLQPLAQQQVRSAARVARTEAPPPQNVVGFYLRGVAYPQNRFSHPQSRRAATSLPRRGTAPFRHSRRRDLEFEVSAHHTSSGPTLSVHLLLVGFQPYSWEAGWAVR